MLYGCSTQKNTRGARTYHELTTRYNVFFNAQLEYEERFDLMFENHEDDWHEMLRMYPNSNSHNDTIEKKLGGPFDRVIEKTTKAIQEHSISAKPIRNIERMGSQAYRDWLKQNEFNPFIDQAWLLLGKAHIQNGDYMEAISVFANTIRLFSHDIDVVSEAQVWLMRAYAEIGWFSDAEVIVDALQSRTIPSHLRRDFVNSYAFLLLQLESYKEVVSILSEAVKLERNKIQRRRLLYLLGQVNILIGDNRAASDAFEKIKGLSTPNEVSLNALLAQSSISGEEQKTIIRLKQQAKRAKNELFANQIYGAIGDYYLNRNDTLKAVENYLKGETVSVKDDVNRAYIQTKLGDIFYSQNQYVEAGNRYLVATEQLPLSFPRYHVVAYRAEVLGELSPHIIAVVKQDSLQYVALLPHEEQVKVINDHIKKLKSNSQTTKRGEQMSNVLPDNLSMIGGEGGGFYFYNKQRVIQGKVEFRKRWGNRMLEDNWRLSEKTNLLADIDSDNKQPVSDSISDDTQSELYSIEYYLRQLPLSADEKAKSDEIIITSLMKIGDIAKNKLYDHDLANDSYLRIATQYLDSPLAIDAIYNLYMLNLQNVNLIQANIYKNILTSDYPGSRYAAMIEHPEYEYMVSDFANMENSLYKTSLEAYRNGDMNLVRENYDKANLLLSNGSLMPKQKLLYALSYAYSSDADSLRVELMDLVVKFANKPEAILAKNILEGLNEGKELVENALIVSDINLLAHMSAETDGISRDTLIAKFSEDKYQPHSVILLFDDKQQKRSDLIFAISNHNFSNYHLRSFSVVYNKIGGLEAMIVKPFNSFDEATYYIDKVQQDSVFKTFFTDSIVSYAISDSNYNMLLTGTSIADYKLFSDNNGVIILGSKSTIREENAQDDKIDGATLEVEPEDVSILIDKRMPYTNHQVDNDLEDKLGELRRRQIEAINQSIGVLSGKDSKRIIQEREAERKKLVRDRRSELKIREKARKLELKRREKERQQKIKEQEEIRKAKIKERNRILREQKR